MPLIEGKFSLTQLVSKVKGDFHSTCTITVYGLCDTLSWHKHSKTQNRDEWNALGRVMVVNVLNHIPLIRKMDDGK